MRAPITIVIPTLNEGVQIAECVRQVDWAADVVVVDGGSSDDTVALARSAGARVINGPTGIAEQRNAGIAVALEKWVFALDADERIGPQLAQELIAARESDAHEAFRVKRRNAFHGRVLHRGHWGNDWVVRFARREFRYGGSAIHPGLQGLRDVGTLRQLLEHMPYHDLAHHAKKLVSYGETSARGLAAQGRRARWSDLTLRPIAHFGREYVLRGAFLDGRMGVIQAGMGAIGGFLKYAFLWEQE
ncbi:MAG TPA: glycosyltransferase family 2 protein [Gemmatimonadales bacterium]|nr:glycosyltransferase family 2 protein [Gemmatimonadales bacterium]